ncbi:hypothetical protein BJX99DRAFT_253584 [Aspergillus californicus]
MSDITAPTVTKVQALIFIIKHQAMSRWFSRAFMLMAVVIRFATSLRLNYEDPKLPFLAHESHRQVMWLVYMIDKMLAAGYQDLTLCRADMMHIQLPCHDNNFQLDVPEISKSVIPNNTPGQTTSISIQALAIRVLWLRQQVLEFTKNVLTMHDVDIYSQVTALQDKLYAFSESLPTPYKLSLYNLRLQVYSSTLPAYVDLHIVWLGAHCILYHLLLGGLKEALPIPVVELLDPDFLVDCKQRCFENAKTITDVYNFLLVLRGIRPLLEYDLAISVYQAARILTCIYQVNPALISREELEIHFRTCQAFLEHVFYNCEGVDAIRKDIAILIENWPFSPAALEETQDTSASDSRKDSLNVTHVLSKHSLIGQMEMEDKGRSFLPSDRFSAAKNYDEQPQALGLSLSTAQMADTRVSYDLIPIGGHEHTAQNPTFVEPIEQSLLDLTWPELGIESFDWLSNTLWQESDHRNLPHY